MEAGLSSVLLWATAHFEAVSSPYSFLDGLPLPLNALIVWLYVTNKPQKCFKGGFNNQSHGVSYCPRNNSKSFELM